VLHWRHGPGLISSTNSEKKSTLLSLSKAASALLVIAAILIPLTIHAATISKPANNLGLVGYWKFDEGAGTTAADFSGNGNTGTITGATWASGKFVNALSFDDDSEQIEVPHKSALSLSAPNATLVAWIYPTVFEGSQAVVVKGRSGSSFNYGLLIKDAGQIVGRYSSCDVVTTAAPVVLNQWQNIAIQYKSDGSIDFYYNGKLLENKAGSCSNMTSASFNLTIGNTANRATDGFHGSIDDVRVYNRALTVGEVQALYNTGAARISAAQTSVTDGLVSRWTFDGPDVTDKVYDRIGGNNGYFIGAATSSAKTIGKLGQALQFNGSTSYASVADSPSLDVDTDFTVSLWVTSTEDKTYSILAKTNKYFSTGTPGWHISAASNPPALIFEVQNGTSRSLINFNTGRVFGWTHIVAVKSGNNTYAYTNGVFQGSASLAGSVANNLNLSFGKLNGSFPLKGMIDDVRIYNRALSASEVKQIYAEGAGAKVNTDTVANTPLTNGLVGYWSFNGPDVTDKIYDRSGNGFNGYLVGTNNATSSRKTIGKVGQAFKFGGVGTGGISIGNDPALTPASITIAAWVNIAATSSYNYIYSNARDCCGSPYNGYELRVIGSNNKLTFGVWNGTLSVLSSVTSITKNSGWTFVAATYDGATERVYVNGNLDNSAAYSGGVGTPASFGTYIGSMGFSGGATHTFAGSLDEVRVYNRALSAAEVKQLYLAGK
jgi:hypothetical protein